MHPPQFRLTQKLSDWPECVIELQCCGGSIGYPVRLLIKRKGDMTFENLVERLHCKRCWQVYASARLSGRGAPPHSSIRAGRGLGRRTRPAVGNVKTKNPTPGIGAGRVQARGRSGLLVL